MNVNININEVSMGPNTVPESDRQADQQVRTSPEMLAFQELQALPDGSAIYETMEELAIVLSGRLREWQNQAGVEKRERRQQALLHLLRRIQEEGEEICFPDTNASDLPELNTARRIFAVGMGLSVGELSREKRRLLRSQLNTLMSEEGWELAIFSMIELGSVDKATLASLKRLMQQAMDEDEIPLLQWFQRIAGWTNRRECVRVLLRTMAFELTACVEASQQRRLAAVLVRLRRLLLFLGLDRECLREESICRLPCGSLLPLLLTIIGERWLFGDWLSAQLKTITTSRRMFNRLLQHLDAQFSLLPEACFNDGDQREQILETIRELKGDRVLP